MYRMSRNGRGDRRIVTLRGFQEDAMGGQEGDGGGAGSRSRGVQLTNGT